MNKKDLLQNSNFRNNQNYILSKILKQKVKNSIINSKDNFYYRNHWKVLIKNLNFNNYDFYIKIFFYSFFIIFFWFLINYTWKNKELFTLKIFFILFIIYFSFLLLKLIYRKIFLKKYIFLKNKKFIYFFKK